VSAARARRAPGGTAAGGGGGGRRGAGAAGRGGGGGTAPPRDLSGTLAGEVAAELERSVGAIKDRMQQARLDFEEAGLGEDVDGAVKHLGLMNSLANALVIHLKGIDQISRA